MSPYKDRVIDADATVYTELREAGAILVAKLSSGAMALTAQWFGGVTRNPWNTQQDASGSSAGPGSATAAGLVAFSIGSDTGGSIIQPADAKRHHRPAADVRTRQPVTAAMALAWTQDTVGPMCRSAEDCALVFDADLRPRRKGQQPPRRAVRLGRHGGRAETSRRLSCGRPFATCPGPARAETAQASSPRAGTTKRRCG